MLETARADNFDKTLSIGMIDFVPAAGTAPEPIKVYYNEDPYCAITNVKGYTAGKAYVGIKKENGIYVIDGSVPTEFEVRTITQPAISLLTSTPHWLSSSTSSNGGNNTYYFRGLEISVLDTYIAQLNAGVAKLGDKIGTCAIQLHEKIVEVPVFGKLIE